MAKKLKKFGFDKDRQRGSHVVFRNETSSRTTTVPDHGKKPLKTGTLKSIIEQAGIDADEFWKA
ncbi:type II toxin-antitoxin system HicA family toxin [Roseiconus nitratireducens]|uniref:type II toxin-antitoxin system HicA family toxin n=1 Tax=Roseiconus nitratireducens TaxID=2605748 RepID=UPI00191C0C2F|nr:type II toxin-antitoxin system HicA family toxin [Roseiconus nitratireducens]